VNRDRDLGSTVHSPTGRHPVSRTTTHRSTTSTEGSPALVATGPLRTARRAIGVGTPPAGRGCGTIRQYADSGTFPGDQDCIDGAAGRPPAPAPG
jgi:hypothetical protein